MLTLFTILKLRPRPYQGRYVSNGASGTQRQSQKNPPPPDASSCKHTWGRDTSTSRTIHKTSCHNDTAPSPTVHNRARSSHSSHPTPSGHRGMVPSRPPHADSRPRRSLDRLSTDHTGPDLQLRKYPGSRTDSRRTTV